MSPTATKSPSVVSAAKWLTARRKLLREEKEFTRSRDRLSARLRKLPWVKVSKPYVFQSPDGRVSLADLFGDCRQLIVQHFMLGPGWEEGCPSCSFMMDHFVPTVPHLRARDTALAAVSRAPLAEIRRFQKRMGWDVNWVSSHGTDFNFDFNVAFTEEQQRKGDIEYNFERGGHAMDATTEVPEPVVKIAASVGTDVPTYVRDRPGMSTFVLQDGVVYHTYSTYARGLDGLWNMYQWLDRAPMGRNETGVWWRRHDEYAQR